MATILAPRLERRFLLAVMLTESALPRALFSTLYISPLMLELRTTFLPADGPASPLNMVGRCGVGSAAGTAGWVRGALRYPRGAQLGRILRVMGAPRGGRVLCGCTTPSPTPQTPPRPRLCPPPSPPAGRAPCPAPRWFPALAASLPHEYLKRGGMGASIFQAEVNDELRAK